MSEDAKKTEADDQVLSGEIEGRFRINALLASGGTAQVYKATHLLLDQTVAIKVLHKHMAASPQAISRFQKEARSLSQLQQGHLSRILGFGVLADGRPYLVMEFVEGETLSQIIANQGPLEPSRALPLFMQICQCLIAMHDIGLLHRDIKPSNVIVSYETDGTETARIIDFGLVQTLSESPEQSLSNTHLTPGTPAYMSPEQCANKTLNAQSDIYSLGCLIYEALCGEPPFTGENQFVLMNRQMHEAISKVPAKYKLPKRLVSIILRCLQKDPGRRQKTMRNLLEELRSCQQQHAGPLQFLMDLTELPNAAKLLILLSCFLLAAGLAAGMRILKQKTPAKVESGQQAPEQKIHRRMSTENLVHGPLLDLDQARTLTGEDFASTAEYYRSWLNCHPHARPAQRAIADRLLGYNLHFAGPAPEARKYNQIAEREYKQLLGSVNPPEEFKDNPQRWTELASLEDFLQDKKEEESARKQEINAKIAAYGPTNSSTLESMRSLGVCYSKQKKYIQEENILKQILVLSAKSTEKEQALENRKLRLISTLIGTEEGRNDQERRAELLKLSQSDDIDVADSNFLCDLAVNQWHLHKPEQARSYLERFHRIVTQASGTSYENRISNLSVLSECCMICENYQLAAKSAEEGLAAWSKIRYQQGDTIAKNKLLFDLLCLASRAYLCTGDSARSGQYFKKACAVRNIESSEFCRALFASAQNHNQPEMAETILKQMAERSRQADRSKAPDLVSGYLTRRLAFLVQFEPSAKEAIAEQARLAANEILSMTRAWSKSRPSQESKMLVYLDESTLAAQCLQLKNLDEAELLYADLLNEADKKELPAKLAPSRTMAILYAVVLEKRGKPAEAAAVRQHYGIRAAAKPAEH